MTATLYHVPRTISSPIVQCLLELDAVGKLVMVKEMTFPELKAPEHLAINPMGTSPALHDPEVDVTIWESGAVLDYLLERHDTENRLHPAPTDSQSTQGQIMARAKYMQLKQYIIATVYPFIASFYIHSLKPEAEWDHDYMDAAKKKCHTVLGPVMTKLLGDGPYFLGDRISAVDILAAKPLSNVKSLGLLNQFPALEALFERVKDRATFSEAYGALDEAKRMPAQSILMVPSEKVVSKPKKRFNWSLRVPSR